MSQKELTDAVLNGGSALDGVNAKIRENGTTTTTTYNQYGVALGKVTSLTQGAGALQKAIGTQTESLKSSEEAYKNMAAAGAGATSSTQKQSAASKDAASSLTSETSAADLAMQALDRMNNKSLNLAQAQTGLASANNSLASSFATNGTAIAGNSAKAVANQGAVQASVTAAQQLADAVRKAGGSQDEETKSLIGSKQALENALQAQIALNPAIQTYIDKIDNIPSDWVTKLKADAAAAKAEVKIWGGVLKSIPTSVVSKFTLSGVAEAQAAIQSLSGELNSLSHEGTTVSNATAARVAHAAAAGALNGHAHGGTIPRFASGGTSGAVSAAVGSATSDSVKTYLSLGEEVAQSYAAGYPGVRPLLKALNADPRGTMQALQQQNVVAAPSTQPI